MECKEWQSHITAYVDGELDSSLTEQFEQHLGQCEQCKARLQAERQVKDYLMHSYRSEKAPFALRARIRKELKAKQKEEGLLRRLFSRPIFAVVAVSLVFFMVTIVYQSIRSVQQEERVAMDFHRELVGTLDCVNCYLAEKANVRNYCKEYGHVPAFISETGEVYSLVANDVSADIRKHSEYLHQKVKISGWVLYQANYIELESFEIQGQAIALGGIKH